MPQLPFATVDDLKARWPAFPAGAESHALTLLEDASDFILEAVPSAASARESTLRRVTCAVVKRAMLAEDGPQGAESFTVTTGPFSDTFKPSNPHGDFYLTRAEKQALGWGRQQAWGASVGGGDCIRHAYACSRVFRANYCDCGAELTLGEPLWP